MMRKVWVRCVADGSSRKARIVLFVEPTDQMSAVVRTEELASGNGERSERSRATRASGVHAKSGSKTRAVAAAAAGATWAFRGATMVTRRAYVML